MKIEFIWRGFDRWEIQYLRMSDDWVRIQARKERRNRKWYQRKYDACEFTYWCGCDNTKDVKAELHNEAQQIIDKFYRAQAAKSKIHEFFTSSL